MGTNDMKGIFPFLLDDCVTNLPKTLENWFLSPHYGNDGNASEKIVSLHVSAGCCTCLNRRVIHQKNWHDSDTVIKIERN